MMKEFLIFIAVMVAFVSGLVWLSLFMAAKDCNSKWANSGYKSQYGAFSGCLIETKPNKWIPADSLRKLDE